MHAKINIVKNYLPVHDFLTDDKPGDTHAIPVCWFNGKFPKAITRFSKSVSHYFYPACFIENTCVKLTVIWHQFDIQHLKNIHLLM